MWLNFYADFDKIGTTEFGGLQVGFDSTQSNPINGAGLFGDTDGDTSRDYRLYKNDVEQDLESGQYEIVSNDNADIDLLEEFLGQEVPAEQTDIDVFDPPNEDFLAFDGTLAFGWHKIQAAVDSESGTATFVIDDLPIGTVDNNIGEPVSLSGGVALSLWDIFSSVSPVPEFSFAVFDNLVVEGSLSIPGDFDGD